MTPMIRPAIDREQRFWRTRYEPTTGRTIGYRAWSLDAQRPRIITQNRGLFSAFPMAFRLLIPVPRSTPNGTINDPPPCLYSDRVARRHRHHGRVDGTASSGSPEGPRGGGAGQVSEQHEADRARDAQLRIGLWPAPTGLRRHLTTG